jgi:hypothetical protein
MLRVNTHIMKAYERLRKLTDVRFLYFVLHGHLVMRIGRLKGYFEVFMVRAQIQVNLSFHTCTIIFGIADDRPVSSTYSS